MKRLLLMACSASKLAEPELMPAIERYDGPAYRMLRARREAARLLPKILILSALYGLIEPKHPIAPYERRMTESDAAMFKADRDARRVVGNACWHADDIFVFGGDLYRDVFRSRLPQHAKDSPLKPIDLPVTWSHGGIGDQLHQLKVWLQ